MRKFVSLMSVSLMALAACSNGGSTTTPTPTGGTTTTVKPTLFGLAPNTQIATLSSTASVDKNTPAIASETQDFFFKSRDGNVAGSADFRRVHYHKQRPFTVRKGYKIPITIADVNGVNIGTGTATFTAADGKLQSDVETRVFNITDVELTNSIFGLLTVDDTGTVASGRNYFDVHGYSAGVNPAAPQANATYSGTFLANVVTTGSSGALPLINLPATLTIDGTSANVTGNFGSDVAIAGAITGSDMSGTATVTSTGVTLTNGSSGTFNGAFYGGGSEAGGTVNIIDGSTHLIGAFGTTMN